MVSRVLVFAYSLACYAAGFAALVYAIGFVGNYIVPKTIDSGTPVDLTTALVTNLPLLALFALQHSIMARQGFKRFWRKIVPEAAERATYVLASAVTLYVLYQQWKAMPSAVWDLTDTDAAGLLTGLYFAGWAIVFISTFLINHFELMGLQQSFSHLIDVAQEPPRFRTPLFYKMVRHPIYTGLLLAFWCTPLMTWGHLIFAVATTGYIFAGIVFEERDLVSIFGERYREYRRTVPMVIPLASKRRRGSRAHATD